MKRIIYCAVFVLVASCTKAQDSSRIQLNPNIYYKDSAKLAGLIDFVDKYIKVHNAIFASGATDWIAPSRRPYWIYPDLEIGNIEVSRKVNDPQFYKPSIISVREVQPSLFQVKLAFMHGFGTGNSILRIVYDLYVSDEQSKFYIYPQVDFNTKNWSKKTVGNIAFVYEASHLFNEKLASRSDSLNTAFAKFFNITPLKFSFYITTSAHQLYEIKGVNFTPEMNYSNQFAGSSDMVNKKVYSGNSTEYYPHENVHLYTYAVLGNLNSFFNEGLATYLGGSRGYPLEYHLKKLSAYLKIHPEINLSNVLDYDYALDDNTNFDYTTAGLICKLIIDKYGKEKLFDLIRKSNTPDTIYNNICTVLKVKRDELHKLLFTEIMKY